MQLGEREAGFLPWSSVSPLFLTSRAISSMKVKDFGRGFELEIGDGSVHSFISGPKRHGELPCYQFLEKKYPNKIVLHSSPAD